MLLSRGDLDVTIAGIRPGPGHASGEPDLGSIQRAIGRSDVGSALELGGVLSEFDAWLADDRQWRHGQAHHWRSLVDDLLERLSLTVALTAPPIQRTLAEHRVELKRLRKALRSGSDLSDDAVRRQLRRLSESIRDRVARPEVLVTAWKRAVGWADVDPTKAEEGMRALRDLAEMIGHSADELVSGIDRVLRDSALDVAPLLNRPAPDNPRAAAGETVESRLRLVEVLLAREPEKAPGVVWLEYLHACIFSPPVLPLGPAATLYQHNFLRSMVHLAPEDDRLPWDVRNRDDDFLLSWLGAADPTKSVRADYELHGDPRVFLRLELPAMGPTQLLAEARETAHFLVAFGALGAENHDLWVLGDSYVVRGWRFSTSAIDLGSDRAQRQMPVDGTALQLSRHADALSRHIPLSGSQLRRAGRLLVWMRQTSSTDSPARVVLCDRAIEQVCGWAGIGRPATFTVDYLKPSWIYTQIRNRILNSYRQLRYSPFGQQSSWTEIDVVEQPPPHSPSSFIGGTNLKAILENLDVLLQAAPSGSDAHSELERLAARLADASAAKSWMNALGTEFDIRNARLRRTRNAIMHGGPIATRTVNHVSDFAVTLAYHALGPAIDILLEDRDLIDGFLNLQESHHRCFARLASGTSPSEALFWDD